MTTFPTTRANIVTQYWTCYSMACISEVMRRINFTENLYIKNE